MITGHYGYTSVFAYSNGFVISYKIRNHLTIKK